MSGDNPNPHFKTTHSTTYNEIFVASLGLTPQIVTESLYHYYSRPKPRFFNRILLLTTEKGKALVVQTLFEEGRLAELEKTLGLAAGTIPLKEEDLIVFSDAQGIGYEDIRTSSASLDEVQQVFEMVSSLTRDDQTRLTVTVAGGRKTMSVTMALAMQLFGRSQDEMIHVLAQPPYDNQSDWFFPQDKDDPLQKIDVVRIPFLRIRTYLPPALLQSGDHLPNVNRIVELTQIQLDQLRPIQKLVVRGKAMHIDGQVWHYPPREAALWRYMARQKLEHCVRPQERSCNSCKDCWVEMTTILEAYERELLTEYISIVGEHSGYTTKRKQKKKYYEKEATIRQTISKFNRLVTEKILSPVWQAQLAITTVGDYIKLYGIPLDKSSLSIEN